MKCLKLHQLQEIGEIQVLLHQLEINNLVDHVGHLLQLQSLKVMLQLLQENY